MLARVSVKLLNRNMTVVAVWDIEDVCYINIDREKMICSAFAKDFDLFLSFSKVCHGAAL